MNGASLRYAGARVKTVGTVFVAMQVAVVPAQAVRRTMPGKMPPKTEPTPGKLSAPLPPSLGGPSVATVPAGNPNCGPVKKTPLRPRLPKLPPVNGYCTKGAEPGGR